MLVRTEALRIRLALDSRAMRTSVCIIGCSRPNGLQPWYACFRIGPLPPIEVFGAFLLDGLIARVSWLTRGSLRQGRSSLAAAHASAAEDFISAAEDFIARGDWREVSLETREDLSPNGCYRRNGLGASAGSKVGARGDVSRDDPSRFEPGKHKYLLKQT